MHNLGIAHLVDRDSQGHFNLRSEGSGFLGIEGKAILCPLPGYGNDPDEKVSHLARTLI